MKTANTMLVLCLVCFLFSGLGCGNSGVEKAKEFMAAGMYPQAKELLDKRIQENPEDAEAHYTLGLCFLNTGDYGRADERFASAVRLKPDYGFQIGGDCLAMLKEASKNGEMDKMKVFVHKAIHYQPGLKKEIAEFLGARGKEVLEGIAQNPDSRTSETLLIA